MKVKLIKSAPWESVTLINLAIVTKVRWTEMENPEYLKPILKWIEYKEEKDVTEPAVEVTEPKKTRKSKDGAK